MKMELQLLADHHDEPALGGDSPVYVWWLGRDVRQMAGHEYAKVTPSAQFMRLMESGNADAASAYAYAMPLVRS